MIDSSGFVVERFLSAAKCKSIFMLRTFTIALITIVFLLGGLSCSKEEYPRIEYRVNSSSSALLTYTMATPTPRQEQVSGSWRVSFRHRQGSSVYLSAMHGLGGNTTIQVYINKELSFSQSTNTPGQIITISEVIP